MLSHSSLEILPLGTGEATKTDEFSENSKRPLEKYVAIFGIFWIENDRPLPLCKFSENSFVLVPWPVPLGYDTQQNKTKLTKLFLYICKSILRGLEIDV